jgi:hypothetical protein
LFNEGVLKLGLIGRIRFGVGRAAGGIAWAGGGLEALEFFEGFIEGPLDAGFVAIQVLDGT